MQWTTVTFGKHKGKILPQIVFTDPDWFFWAYQERVFSGKGSLEAESEEVNKKARSIRIPQTGPEKKLIAEYDIHPTVGRFSDLNLIPESQRSHGDSTPKFRSDVVDLYMPRKISPYDKLGGQLLISSLKTHLFHNQHIKFTRKFCADFFNDDSNFIL